MGSLLYYLGIVIGLIGGVIAYIGAGMMVSSM